MSERRRCTPVASPVSRWMDWEKWALGRDSVLPACVQG